MKNFLFFHMNRRKSRCRPFQLNKRRETKWKIVKNTRDNILSSENFEYDWGEKKIIVERTADAGCSVDLRDETRH